MSAVLERSTAVGDRPAQARLRIFDSDIHPSLASPTALHPFLPAQWREHLIQYGVRPHGHLCRPWHLPPLHPNTARRDAWPPNGQPPGSDLAFMQAQHLDRYDIEIGVLEPLIEANVSRNLEFGAAMASAANDWQVETFTSRERRLKASVLIVADDAEAAVAEIERRASDPSNSPRSNSARGRSSRSGASATGRSSPAAEAANLPIGFHVGGPSAHAPSASGWPSFYAEDHHVPDPQHADPGGQHDPGRRF